MSETLEPLTPNAFELAATVASLLNVVLLAYVLVQVVRGRIVVPYGVLGYIVMFALPVVGPLLVLGLVRSQRRAPAA